MYLKRDKKGWVLQLGPIEMMVLERLMSGEDLTEEEENKLDAMYDVLIRSRRRIKR